MDPLFDRFLNSVRQFLKDANELTRADEELLAKLQTNFQAVSSIPEEEYELKKFLEDTCIRMLQSGYIIQKCKAGALSKVLREISLKESKLPKHMQPIVGEIRSYFDLIQEQHKKINACLEKIMTQIEEYADRESRTLSQREKNRLEMGMLTIDGDAEIAENYHKHAEKALESLRKEVHSYLIRCGVLAVVSVVTAAGAGAAAGAGLCQAVGNVQRVREIAGMGSLLVGTTAYVYEVNSFFDTKDELARRCNEIQGELNVFKANNEKNRMKLSAEEKIMAKYFKA